MKRLDELEIAREDEAISGQRDEWDSLGASLSFSADIQMNMFNYSYDRMNL